MPKKAISVTLEEQNLTWLRGRTLAGKRRSISDALDAVVSAARLGTGHGDARSVAGTIDLSATDPDLASADAVLAALVAGSLHASGRKAR